ncbi:hypothetical protein [Henriciella litoralis]|uniref:hypothetical protein n=1 Tax=Henriciella litoralis TaxID=568102 RepID=UPI000A0353A3|nr:hypothetical protein [Henriciella litoralis]
MTTPALEEFKQTFSEFSDKTVSVYIPRPAVETGGEKWRILRKNVIDAVESHAPKSSFILERLANFELADFRANGIALFDDGEHHRMAHLSARPVASISTDEPPFILPLLADMQSHSTHWVLAITKGKPKLFLYANGFAKDMTDRLDAPGYRSVEARRQIQDDVFFHSGSRGREAARDGQPMYHSLGSDQSEEREKTDEAFYHDVFNAVEEALPPQTQSLHVIGEEGTVGHFASIAANGRFDIVQHHAGGQDDLEAKIVDAFKDETSPETDLPAPQPVPDLETAARSGQIGTLYVPTVHALLEEMHENADEHVKLRDFPEGSDEMSDNRTAMLAIMNGADIMWYTAERHDAVAELRADMRW